MTLPERVEPTVRDMTVGAALWRAAEVDGDRGGGSRRCLSGLARRRAGHAGSPCGRRRRGAAGGSRDLGRRRPRQGEPPITAEDQRISRPGGWAIRPRALPARPFKLWARRNIVLWPSRHQSARSRRGASRGNSRVPRAADRVAGPRPRDWAWGGSTGKGVKVCILDSGIEAAIPTSASSRAPSRLK